MTYAKRFPPVRYCQHCGLSTLEALELGIDEALVAILHSDRGPAGRYSTRGRLRYEHPSCKADAADKAEHVDAFDAWCAANGELITEHVDGEEVVVDPQPTIADFAFAIEVAAGPSMGRLFA